MFNDLAATPDHPAGAVLAKVSTLPSRASLVALAERECEKFLDRLEEELSSDLDEAREWIMTRCGSHERMDAVMYLHGQMDFGEWLSLLGDIWCICDNIGLYKEDLVWIFKEWLDEPLTLIPELMSPEERAAFEALPDQVTIYRGCGPHNKDGLSWSLSADVAVRFPFSMRYGTDQPMLLTTTINKSRIAALKLERNEQEVIVVDLPASCWIEEFLTEPPPPR